MPAALSALARQASAALPFPPSRVPSSQLPPEALSRPAARARTALQALLDRCATLDPALPSGYTNHLPMALHALARLGADADRLEAFAHQYLMRQGLAGAGAANGGNGTNGTDAAEGAPPPPPAPPQVLPGWQRLRGLADAYGPLREAMVQGLALHGTGPWVRGVLPALWPGLGAAALHGPIRVAHALQAGHDAELASALAFWASRWRPLPAVAATDPQPWADWVVALQAAGGRLALEAPSISHCMAEASRSPLYQHLLARAPQALPLGEALARLVPVALQGHALSGDFTVLHLVTGLRAVRVLLPWLPPQTDASVLWRVVVAGWLAAPLHRASFRPLPRPDTLPGWPALRAAACAQDDDHVIKLVHACQDHAAHGLADGALCRQAAARALTGTPG
ncbi:questin oxidase family protein [Ideonella dechloratans]|uniref:Questin oxidase family protein n=1 Tax=Ideonella dechloratans TaxID=36863 RepID=A0A643F9F7_IDEDE|nr:questin oxidase family protein [Ideonella dechloratans]KAB0579725.1 questin oxidase family protein [Ideonella dechloratans]UFU10088.1 questin oxidase family protein [Ideonella dechloratans]